MLMIDSIELAVTYESKATLHSRAGPLLRHMKVCTDGCVQCVSLDGVIFFKFLEPNKESCASIFPCVLLGSVAFMKNGLGLKSADEDITTVSLKKRKTLQRPPL